MAFVVVLGAGESGVGAALLAAKQGYAVLVSDRGAIADKYKAILLQNELEWEENKHSQERILTADLVVKSPGIPDKAALIQALSAAGIEIISEIEFAARFTEAMIVAITGSNGKTTTTMLTHHLLREGGMPVCMGGNIGTSFAGLVAEENCANYVLEISSFQLDGISAFKPHIAILCNITPDHLDRYDYQFEKYVASKFRIVMNQDENDYLIYDADDTVIVDYLTSNKIKAQLVPFSVEKSLEYGAWLTTDKKMIKIKTDDNTLEMNIDTLALEGIHNVKNTMAAAAAANLLKIRKDSIRTSVQSFQGAEHRLEPVLKINHVRYINDSKATNVNATFFALDSVKTPTVWIVGGVDKGNDYSSLMPMVREKVKAVICLGEDNTKLKEAFEGVVDVFVETYAMSEAVKVAYKIAERGDTVLLSPACASFDLFNNYEDRGNQFKAEVRNL